jgi:hypothetical protein
VHALNLSQKHIGKTGPRKTDTYFVTALEQKGSFFDPTLMQIKGVRRAMSPARLSALAITGLNIR